MKLTNLKNPTSPTNSRNSMELTDSMEDSMAECIEGQNDLVDRVGARGFVGRILCHLRKGRNCQLHHQTHSHSSHHCQNQIDR